MTPVRDGGGVRRLVTPPHDPVLFLLDGGPADAAGLRRDARGLASELGLPFVSRSYAAGWALVGGHTAPLGVDIEAVTVWTPEQATSVHSPDEPSHDPGDHLTTTSVWSGKEALAKALGDAVDYDPRRLVSPHWWADGAAGRWRARRLPAPDGHVGWVCWTGTGRPART